MVIGWACRARKVGYPTIQEHVAAKLLLSVSSAFGSKASEKGRPFELVLLSCFFSSFSGRKLSDVLVLLGMKEAELPAWCRVVHLPHSVQVVSAAYLGVSGDVNVWEHVFRNSDKSFVVMPENGCEPGTVFVGWL
jgi:hypothetical protein